MFSEPYLRPWVFLWTAQVEGALTKQGAEPAEEGGTSREGLNEARWSTDGDQKVRSQNKGESEVREAKSPSCFTIVH